MANIIFTEKGWQHYVAWQAEDKKTLKKINKLIKSIKRDGPINGEGEPEKLKFQDNEYGRRINEEDRFLRKLYLHL